MNLATYKYSSGGVTMWKYVIMFYDPENPGVIDYQCYLVEKQLTGKSKEEAIHDYAISQGLDPEHVIGALEATPNVYVRVAIDGSSFLFTTKKVEGQ